MISGLLIAGTSHVGKSTLAAEIGRAFNWEVIATDKLKRHPGRPWPSPPAHVEQFYLENSDKVISQRMLQHHRNMWPNIKQIIREKREGGKSFVFEGSALRPEFMGDVVDANIVGICLYADEQFLQGRISRQSNYKQIGKRQQILVDKFIHRSLTDNRMIVQSAQDIGLQCIDVSNQRALVDFSTQFAAQANISNSNQ